MKIVVVLALLASLTAAQNYKRVCYFANWAFYRTNNGGAGQYWVDKLDPFECTHLIYAFAVLDRSTYEMKVFDTWADLDNKGYETFVGLKRRNPALKTLIALGGWNDSQFSTQYSEMVSNSTLREKFVRTTVQFISQYGFDGLDFDWEYPGDPGKPSDKENLILLFRELKAAFASHNWLLTMAPTCSLKRAQLGYDIKGIADTVDFVNFMGYDIYGAWDRTVDQQAPLHRRPWDDPNATVISESVDYWLQNGMPAEKLIFGVPLYGRAFRLADCSKTNILSPAIGAATAGRYTGEDGFLAYYEICQYQQQGWVSVTSAEAGAPGTMGPYAYGTTNGKCEWVGWDDPSMVIDKVKYAMDKKLGGIMVWDLSLDDFNGFCGLGPRPMLRAINDTLHGIPFNTSTPAPIDRTTTIPHQELTCSPVNEGHYFADPADCNKFYHCVNQHLIVGSCPEGLALNEPIQSCDYPNNVPGCRGCCGVK